MASTDTPRRAIASSRRLCVNGDFALATQALSPWISDSEAGSAIKAEIVRVHLVQGDRKSASSLLEDVITTESSGPSHDLLSTQAAFINVAACGDLSGALQTASSMWLKYGNEVALMDEDDSLVSPSSC